MQHHPVVSQEQWLAARHALLVREREFTHLRDKAQCGTFGFTLGQG